VLGLQVCQIFHVSLIALCTQLRQLFNLFSVARLDIFDKLGVLIGSVLQILRIFNFDGFDLSLELLDVSFVLGAARFFLSLSNLQALLKIFFKCHHSVFGILLPLQALLITSCQRGMMILDCLGEPRFNLLNE